MEIIEMERRRREFAENTCRGRGWTEAQCAEVLAGVTIDPRDGRLTFETSALSANHPLRQRMSGQYPVHQHMMVMGRIADLPSYHHQEESPAPVEFKADRIGIFDHNGENVIERAMVDAMTTGIGIYRVDPSEFLEAADAPRVSVSTDLRPERRPIVARQADMESAERRIYAGRSIYHVDNGSPDDERGISSWVLDGKSSPRCGSWDDWCNGASPDPLAAMTCHRDTHTLERLPLPPAPPRKPLLIVPDGCVLVIPDGVQPWEFLARFDTSQSSRTGVIVNKGGYRLLGGLAEKQKAEAATERRTHAALTFEQPIQNRLGRMAR